MLTKHQAKNKDIFDGENNPVALDIVYTVTENLPNVLSEIQQHYGIKARLIPLSATSAGGGIFQIEKPKDSIVIGIQITPAITPKISHNDNVNIDVDIQAVALDQIIIDKAKNYIYAGSAITLQQLNQSLSDYWGNQHKVLGADLTSYTYAQVGATFMTGGMGPQRRYFSDSVNQIALHDGANISTINSEELTAYAGTYGWTGLVTAVRCDISTIPTTEIAFALPVNNTPEGLAKLLAHFAPFVYLNTENGIASTLDENANLILGIEHITTVAMQPLLVQPKNTITQRAQQLVEKCQAANADGLVFINGYTNLPFEEFLAHLFDNQNTEQPTIAGIQLDHTELFNNPEEMRAVREAVPFAARTQAPKGKYSFKGHTDATIRLNPNKVTQAMQRLWSINLEYTNSIQQYFDNTAELEGQILIYGHLNPYGVDPHNRITLATDNHDNYQAALIYLNQQHQQFLINLKTLCEETDSTFVGGEKGAGSESEMFALFHDIKAAPSSLQNKLAQQKTAINNASPLFNWRALPPYR